MPRDFTIVLRGYEPAEVDAALDRADAALTSGDETARAAARGALADGFTVALRGYDRFQVDAEAEKLRAQLGDGPATYVPKPDNFVVVLRGYDRGQVESALAAADAALTGESEMAKAAARDALRAADFTVVFRGYDRVAVKRAVERRLNRLG